MARASCARAGSTPARTALVIWSVVPAASEPICTTTAPGAMVIERAPTGAPPEPANEAPPKAGGDGASADGAKKDGSPRKRGGFWGKMKDSLGG